MKKKIKKLIKIAGYIFVGLCLLLVLAEISLRYILPLESVKAKTLAYISQTVGADIKTDKISASLFGIKLNNVSVYVAGGTLFQSKNLQVKLNPFKLLIGQIYISKIIVQNPVVKISRSQDGTFNFEPLLPEEEKETETPPAQENLTVPLDIRIQNLSVRNGQISYVDLKEDMKANLQNLNFNLSKFSFYKPFYFNLSFEPYFEQGNMVLDGAKFTLEANAHLNKFNLQDATFNLKKLLFEYKDTSLKAQAKVSNFENPSGRISSELKNLSDETLADFTEILPFNIPLINTDITFDYFVKDSKANIKNLLVKTTDTELNIKSNIDLNKNEISGGKITVTSILDSLKDLSPLLEEFKPKGKVQADFDFAWPLSLAGNLALADIGLFTDKAGTLENLNTNIEVKSIDEINIDTLTGILNKKPFTMKANYKKQEKFADVFLDFKADKFYVFNTAPKENKTEVNQQSEQQKEQEQQQQQEEPGKKSEFSFVPVNVNAKVDIKKLDTQFIKGNNFTFNTNAKNITMQLDQVHGLFDLNIQNGQIKDIYTISNANAVTKVMFMSLGIVSKVINTLNVLDLLNGMGKVLAGKGEQEEEDLPVHQEINGKMDFDSFKTNIDFNEGLATMKRCAFVSSLFSFRVNGNINFNDRKIKLNVDSAPGRHTENGIMPLNIDIGGTIEEPKGSLSVISSVADLVGNTISNNPVSNMLKSTWGSLFKSSSEEESENEENTPQEDNREEEK